jgi:UPF0716 protein FxsA
MQGKHQRERMRTWLFVGVITYASVEVAVLIEFGRWIGLGWVMLWVAGTVILGIAALRTQGIRALRRVAQQLQQEILPTREIVDLALVTCAGVLLISPGILADLLGLLLLIPPFRVAMRHVILHVIPQWVPEEIPQARLRAAAENVIEIERDPSD